LSGFVLHLSQEEIKYNQTNRQSFFHAENDKLFSALKVTLDSNSDIALIELQTLEVDLAYRGDIHSRIKEWQLERSSLYLFT
jgi:hypothetical protein